MAINATPAELFAAETYASNLTLCGLTRGKTRAQIIEQGVLAIRAQAKVTAFHAAVAAKGAAEQAEVEALSPSDRRVYFAKRELMLAEHSDVTGAHVRIAVARKNLDAARAVA